MFVLIVCLFLVLLLDATVGLGRGGSAVPGGGTSPSGNPRLRNITWPCRPNTSMPSIPAGSHPFPGTAPSDKLPDTGNPRTGSPRAGDAAPRTFPRPEGGGTAPARTGVPASPANPSFPKAVPASPSGAVPSHAVPLARREQTGRRNRPILVASAMRKDKRF